MEKILFIANTEQDGTIARAGLETLATAAETAKALSAPLSIGLLGANTAPAAAQLAGVGADRALAVTGPELASGRYATDAAAVEALVRASGATVVLAAHTSRLARVFPGVAQRVNGRVDTHATSVSAADGGVAIQRWFYKQRIEATLKRTQRPWLVLVEPGTRPAFAGSGAAVVLEAVAAPALAEAAKRTRVMGLRSPKSDAQTIKPDAKVLLVAGAGWTKKQADGKPHMHEAEKLILDFLSGAKASLGSSKSLVDLSGEGNEVFKFMTHMNQVGQTGATPRHPKGLATCCHGEEPHVVGWRFINERRAINMDANCGWARGKADVVYIGDAFEIMGKVNALLAAKQG